MSRTLALLALLVMACDRPKEPDPRQLAARALQGALSYPNSTILAVNAGSEAAEVTLTTADPVDRVAGWFRQALPMNGWQLRKEGKGAGGAVSIYAEKDGRPLWLALKPNTGGPGTTYTLIGAIMDSTATP